MNLDELRAVLDDERATGELQPLRPEFYTEAREFIEEIEVERNSLFEAADDPLSDPALERLNDKHKSATTVLASIFENRVSKLLTHAMTVAAGDESETPPMTTEEAGLYRVAVEAIRTTKADALEGEAGRVDPPDPPSDPTPSTATTGADSDGRDDSDTQDEDLQQEAAAIDQLAVRVIEDIGTILGVDEREYDLAAGDVVSLPLQNAQALIEREVAEPIESE